MRKKNIIIGGMIMALIIIGVITLKDLFYSHEPQLFINNLVSYQTIEATKQIIMKDGVAWDIKEDSKLSKDDKRPQFDIYIVLVSPYSHLGQTGHILIEFYNDRLMDITFYPGNYLLYLNVLKEKEGIDITAKDEMMLGNNVRISKGKDMEGGMYVSWEDMILLGN